MAQPARCPFPAATALLEQAVRDHVFPGCAFAVLAPGHTLPWAEGAQAIGQFTYEPDSPRVEPGTIFDLASLTKVLATTAAVMRLYDRRQLGLDVPLAEWLPEFAAAEVSDTRRLRVTLRMLLDHSSGLPGYARLFESANDRLAMIDACLRLPLTADPGTRSEYSDIGFIILGYLVETITGEQLDHFCHREVFAPLDMSATCFCPERALRASIPPTEDDRSFRHRAIQGEAHDENASVMGGVSGHAGLFSNAADPLRIAACILADGVAPSGSQLFSAQTVAQFAEPAAQPPGTSRALGWDTPSVPSSSGSLFSARSIGHLGFTGTSLWIDLDAGIAVTLLTNRTWPDRSNQAIRELRPRFHDAVRRELTADQKRSWRCEGTAGHNSDNTISQFPAARFDKGGKILIRTFPKTNMATLTPASRMTETAEGGAISSPTERVLHELMTESANSASQGFDTKSALEIARIINHEDHKIAGAVKKALPEIALVIDAVARALRDGGRLIYVAAGSSGRIAALDASECPPAYSTSPQSVQYIVAGGPKAVASAVEVNEDSPELGQRDIARRRPTRKDVVIGLSASGRTPYVVGAVEYARSRGAQTAAITCNQNTALAAAAEIAIIAEVGPEVISGSTRMKAATAQKMITNMITTGAMTRLGYVYENMMVNVHMHNAKLVERGIGVLMRACNIDRDTAVQTIKSAGKSVPIALVMLKAGVDKPEAVRRLAKSDGNVRLAIEDTVLEL